jgi:hypothetical protein
MAKAAFNKQKDLSNNKLNLNLRKKPVMCNIWSTASYGAESGLFGKEITNIWEVLKRGTGEGWRRSIGTIL